MPAARSASAHHAVFRFKPGSEQALKAELLHRLKDKSTRVFVYQDADTWAGMLVASLRPGSAGFKLSSKGYIGETVVCAGYRGKGIGKELFEAARKWLSDRGADHLELQVSVQNPRPSASGNHWASPPLHSTWCCLCRSREIREKTKPEPKTEAGALRNAKKVTPHVAFPLTAFTYDYHGSKITHPCALSGAFIVAHKRLRQRKRRRNADP
ncbi:GNAT family N-acetyltransferase [Pontibacter sp. BAB1700]|uniref:GNAT family N-acetyltransferase n=1 Tax=Pontibacter sp. BAB1700 TaxID=1144253 RepID=UPI00026BC4CA|nr:GNAT family N-acetyltransferase [Pontibacter sp. BAB1700]EJF11671.1 hypothetical protein O71_01438 [Pontibacter sp. BAB1700]